MKICMLFADWLTLDIGIAIQHSKAAEGWISLWRGWSPSLMRDLPFSGLLFFVAEFQLVPFVAEAFAR